MMDYWMHYDQANLGMRIRDYLKSRAERATEELGALQREIRSVKPSMKTGSGKDDSMNELKRKRDSLIEEVKNWEGHAKRMDKKYKQMIHFYLSK